MTKKFEPTPKRGVCARVCLVRVRLCVCTCFYMSVEKNKAKLV